MAYYSNYPYNPYTQNPGYYGQNQGATASTPTQAGFIRVPSEDYARNFQLAPGTSGTFIDDSRPYCYVKTMDASPLGTFKFERYRLVKEEDDHKAEQSVSSPKQDYAVKNDLKALWDEINKIKEALKEDNDHE
jgi:hypothetical protein